MAFNDPRYEPAREIANDVTTLREVIASLKQQIRRLSELTLKDRFTPDILLNIISLMVRELIFKTRNLQQ